MKVPVHEFDQTVAFYRDIIALKMAPSSMGDSTESVVFQFGDKQLWIDKVAGISQAEIWLEIITDDAAAASKHLERHNLARRDEIERLPEQIEGFWISSPSNIIHLIRR